MNSSNLNNTGSDTANTTASMSVTFINDNDCNYPQFC